MSCSVRTRDRNMNSIIQLATDAVILKISRLLFIQGDKPAFEETEKAPTLSNPTDAVNLLTSIGFDKLIDFDLSIPNKVSNHKLFQKRKFKTPQIYYTINKFNSRYPRFKRSNETQPYQVYPLYHGTFSKE